MRVEFHGVLWSDQGARGLTTAKAEPGTVGIRRLEAPGRDPAPVGHDHGPSCEPVAIVDHHMGIALVLDGNQVRANHACSLPRPLADPKCRRNLGAQVGAAKPEFIDRACQRERLKSSHSEIFDQAKTHHPSPCSRGALAFKRFPGAVFKCLDAEPVQRRGTRRTPLCPPFARGEKSQPPPTFPALRREGRGG